ncbi:MAG TPA: hypothetical protein VN516_02315 [Candidatus Baltobacteraceae bacterium]|nr:hypothetical protein [Candidatus Baltobacteraceae bacterium]
MQSNPSLSPNADGQNSNSNQAAGRTATTGFANPNHNSTSSQTPSSAAGSSNQPPNFSGDNNNGMSRNYGGGNENLDFTNRVASPSSRAQGFVIAPADDPDAVMSSFDKQIVKVLHGVIEWVFPFLLLLLLFYLIYKLRQIFRRNEERRRRENDFSE